MALLLAVLALVTGCSANAGDTVNPSASPGTAAAGQKPAMPSKIQEYEDKVPVLDVYVVDTKKVEKMTLEDYLCGVLAGEMKNDWPLEALKAQAILARTFVLRFMTEKESQYEGADVSTDIKEAQAYNADEINDRVRQAVEETRGMVLVSNGEFPYAWFHAHSGGKTELAKPGLNWKDAEPAYTKVADGQENDSAAKDAQSWTATFTKAQVLEAAKTAGLEVATLETIEIGEKSESGRAVTLKINGKEVNAPDFRVEIGSTEMRSTMLTELKLEGDKVIMAGKGFGHGVGMTQWGAYAQADAGKKAEEIVMSYFQNVEIVEMY